MLSIVIPAYNEETRLPDTLGAIRNHFDAGGEPYEILVVDDGSTDGTVAAANRLARDWPELRVIPITPNKGKGAAVRVGMLEATGETRAFVDADLSTPLDDLDMLRSFLGTNYQVVIASRAVRGSTITKHQPAHRVFMGRVYNLLVRVLLLPKIHDTQCGCKIFTASAAKICFTDLVIERFGFDVESLVRAERAGLHIREVPVTWAHAEASRVSSVRDSFQTFVDLLRVKFSRYPGGGSEERPV